MLSDGRGIAEAIIGVLEGEKFLLDDPLVSAKFVFPLSRPQQAPHARC